MKTPDQTACKKTGFTWVEVLVGLTILLGIAGFAARILYREELHEVDVWFEETFGFSGLWVMVPAVALYLIFRVRSGRKKVSKRGRLRLP
jgi:hypothetical protein